MTLKETLEMEILKDLGKVFYIPPPIGQAIQCVFDQTKEEEVYQALRKPVRLTGIARTNPNTGRPEELRIKTIEIIEPLIVGARDFFLSRSIDQLPEPQGVKPLPNPPALEGGLP